MNLDDPDDALRGDDASEVAERASDLRRAILLDRDASQPATVGDVAAALALVERLAAIIPTSD